MDLDILKQAVTKGRFKEIEQLTRQALEDGSTPRQILDQALVPAMEMVGAMFSAGDIFIPEMMVSAKVMQKSLDVLKPLMVGDITSNVGRFAIGTVKDDLHDIGKNIVISMMQGAGFEVIDLGIDCPPEKFIQAIKDGAQLLGMSAILTTVVENIRRTIEAIKESGLREQVKILAGGAAVNESLALKMGADAYCEDAGEAPPKAKSLLAQLG
ncbi:MAG: cobalamin-binding protein [Desulfarculus sp.]|jgi:5-methyltetrahydrofolate--homocysteine methyltransferase|nr:MAG: cobalamin-binding protein [Desulfarculus sp.]